MVLVAISLSLIQLIGEQHDSTEEKHNLRYIFYDGQSCRYAADSCHQYTLDGIKHKWNMSIVYSLLTRKVEYQKKAVISISYDSAAIIHTTGDIVKYDYDSKRDVDAPTDYMPRILSCLVSKSFEFTITPYGRVVGVLGVNNLKDNIINNIKGDKDPSFIRWIKLNMNEKYFGATVRRIFIPLPEKALSVGDMWSEAYNKPWFFGTSMCFSDTWFKSASDDNALMRQKVNYIIYPPNAEQRIYPGELNVRGESRILFSHKDGHIISCEMKSSADDVHDWVADIRYQDKITYLYKKE